MEGKLRELTDRIYQEGVQRAKNEAEEILAQAQKEADAITAEARKEAHHISEHARKEIQQLRENTLQELQFSSRQALADLKQKIAELITLRQISDPLNTALNDAEFLQHLIQTAISNWNPQRDAGPSLQVLLPEKEQGQLDTFIAKRTQEFLSQGVHIRFDERLNDGFRIGPADGSFLVSFAEEDFEQFFRLYLRPQVDRLLFEKSDPA